jgi:hypothetical protein
VLQVLTCCSSATEPPDQQLLLRKHRPYCAESALLPPLLAATVSFCTQIPTAVPAAAAPASMAALAAAAAGGDGGSEVSALERWLAAAVAALRLLAKPSKVAVVPGFGCCAAPCGLLASRKRMGPLRLSGSTTCVQQNVQTATPPGSSVAPMAAVQHAPRPTIQCE